MSLREGYSQNSSIFYRNGYHEPKRGKPADTVQAVLASARRMATGFMISMRSRAVLVSKLVDEEMR